MSSYDEKFGSHQPRIENVKDQSNPTHPRYMDKNTTPAQRAATTRSRKDYGPTVASTRTLNRIGTRARPGAGKVVRGGPRTGKEVEWSRIVAKRMEEDQDAGEDE